MKTFSSERKLAKVKQYREIGGFTLIELMFGLAIMGIISGMTPYFGSILKNRAEQLQTVSTAPCRIANAIADYHEETGEWSFATNIWMNMRQVCSSLVHLVDTVFPGNTYFTAEERKNGFSDLWIYIDANLTRRNVFGEDFLTELRNRTLRNAVSQGEIYGGYERVYHFLPKKGDRSWIDSQAGYNQRYLQNMNKPEDGTPN